MVADGVVDQFGEGVEVEFEHDIGAMGFGRVDADAEKIGDFLVGLAFGEELEDFAFAGSDARAGGLGRDGVRGGEFVGASGRNAGGKVGLMLAGGVNGGEEDAVGFVFEDVAASAGMDNSLNEVVGFVHGENEDFCGRRDRANAAGGIDAIEERHADVQDGDIGFEFAGFVDGVASIGGLGAHFPSGAGFEESAKTGANDGMVIRDQDA